jgi:AcrR family transcriptional regulator
MNELKVESRESAKDTMHRLLAAGRRLFARGGFEGTSVRTLTEEAGANLGAVTYHFGSKENLYHAILEMIAGPVRERAQGLVDLPLPAIAKIELFVRGMFEHLRANPDIPRFMVQEIVLGDEPAEPILETIRQVAPALVAIIEEGQREGSIRDGDPVLMGLSTLSQPIYLSIMPPVLGRDDLRTAGVPQPNQSPEDHAVDFVLRAIEARKEEAE